MIERFSEILYAVPDHHPPTLVRLDSRLDNWTPARADFVAMRAQPQIRVLKSHVREGQTTVVVLRSPVLPARRVRETREGHKEMISDNDDALVDPGLQRSNQFTELNGPDIPIWRAK